MITHGRALADPLQSCASVIGSVSLLTKQLVFSTRALSYLLRTDHFCQRRKLVGNRDDDGVDFELAFADHVDQLDTSERGAGSAE